MVMSAYGSGVGVGGSRVAVGDTSVGVGVWVGSGVGDNTTVGKGLGTGSDRGWGTKVGGCKSSGLMGREAQATSNQQPATNMRYGRFPQSFMRRV